jgi:hypothetical protein
VRIGVFPVKDSACALEFAEWKSVVRPTVQLQEVWVLISGAPESMYINYLICWGMGRFIGKTKKIDMAYTREYGVVKALVKVVDIASIPYKKLIFHEDEGYYLTFEIEEEVDMVEDDDPTNGDDKDFNSREKEQEKRKDPKGDNSKNGNSSREPQPKNDFPMSGGSGGSDVNKVRVRLLFIHCLILHLEVLLRRVLRISPDLHRPLYRAEEFISLLRQSRMVVLWLLMMEMELVCLGR